jgi:hypothetical protein
MHTHVTKGSLVIAATAGAIYHLAVLAALATVLA